MWRNKRCHPTGRGAPSPGWSAGAPKRFLCGNEKIQILRVTHCPLHVLFDVRKTRPEEGSDVVAGEDAHSPGDEGHAPQPAVVVLPEDADPFSLLQLQLVRSVSHVGVESHAPGERGGERGSGCRVQGGCRASCSSRLAAEQLVLPALGQRRLFAWSPFNQRSHRILGCCCYIGEKEQPVTSGRRGYE